MAGEQLLNLMKSKNTVFTTKDIALLWKESDPDLVKKKLFRYLKSGKIYSVRRGIYAKDENYNRYELAGKIFTPAYLSFETVLAKAGVIFQFYNKIFVASYLSRELGIAGQNYSFKKLKYSILINQLGIEMRGNYFIASPERALLDIIYLNKEYYFDNLSGINWDKVNQILPIYGNNKRMARKIKEYQKLFKKD